MKVLKTIIASTIIAALIITLTYLIRQSCFGWFTDLPILAYLISFGVLCACIYIIICIIMAVMWLHEVINN